MLEHLQYVRQSAVTSVMASINKSLKAPGPLPGFTPAQVSLPQCSDRHSRAGRLSLHQGPPQYLVAPGPILLSLSHPSLLVAAIDLGGAPCLCQGGDFSRANFEMF